MAESSWNGTNLLLSSLPLVLTEMEYLAIQDFMAKRVGNMEQNRPHWKYLKLFIGTFPSLFRRDIGLWPLLGKVHHDEIVSRFLLDGDVRQSDSTIRPKAFRPPLNSGDLSVYRIKNLVDQTIWRIGKYFVEKASTRNKRLIGRADLSVRKIMSIHPPLSVVPVRLPHPRHANISNFPVLLRPEDEPNEVHREEQKQYQKNIAQQLAETASRVPVY